MDAKQQKSFSKFMSLVLRHHPARINLELDPSGWCSVDDLLQGMRVAGRQLSRTQLEFVVAENDKQRFEFSEDGRKIRARQGHSVSVELGYEPTHPPKILFHGTPTKFVESIRRQGLRKQKRHHVHLHEDIAVASSVGARRGEAVVLRIQSGRMADEGSIFYVTPNRVWLTDHVPVKFIEFA